jgi:2-iminobutanoate/2-iminopropanoate deaminase
MEATGADLHDVISVRVYLADLANWPAFNEIYRRYFTPPYPSRTAIGAQLLGGFLVEVDAIAKIPDPSD